MLKHPVLNSRYHAEFLEDGKILLMSEKENVVLSGEPAGLVLKNIIEKNCPANELVDHLSEKTAMLEIYLALNELEQKGYIVEHMSSEHPENSAFLNAMGMDVIALKNALEEKPVTLEKVGSVHLDPFFTAFAENGIRTTGCEKGKLKVIVTDDYGREVFRKINRDAIRNEQPFFLVKPVGIRIWIGPLFLPGTTGCWACLKQRLDINRPFHTLLKAGKHTPLPSPIPEAFLPSSLRIAADLTALEIMKWIYFEKNDRLEGRIFTLDLETLESRFHELVRRPQCPECGSPDLLLKKPGPVILNRTPAFDLSSGGFRTVSPEDTIHRYLHHESPITGVVRKLSPYFHIAGAPIYNYTAGKNTAFLAKNLFWLDNHIRNASGGKGKTESQARAGALCEAIERYSIVWHEKSYSLESNLWELGEQGIHPNACMNFSERQYQNREESNRECSKFYLMTPVRFDETLSMDWTPVYSMTEKNFKYLPTCFCFAQYPEMDDFNRFSYPDSNGCASGNTLEEAILQGFLELVERDAAAIWWYNRIRRPSVDLASFNDPWFDRLRDFYASIHRDLIVLDLTADLEIPVFAAVSRRKNEERQDIIFGFGAHVDAKIGLERALTELNQILPVVHVPDRSGPTHGYRTSDPNFLDWLKTATLENQFHLRPTESVPPKKAGDFTRLCKPDIYESIGFCIRRAAENGLETLVLNMTLPDVEMPVVRVFVPGMRHFWKRLGPGRLYDIPVRMGWRKKPLTESEMNPVGMFI